MSYHPPSLEKIEPLVEELAEFWISALEQGNWEQRLQVLNKIHDQLRADLATKAEFDMVSPRFVSAIIERLGAPPVEAEAQAKIYAYSLNEVHRDAATAWSLRSRAPEVADHSDRRRFPRKVVNMLSEIWIQGFTAPCRLIDISLGGARVALQQIEAPEPGTEVRVVVPGKGICEAIVVFVNNSLEAGLRFSHQPEPAMMSA
ncbi:MAG: PilZ domain-containing protein [Halochromatium sp.]